jgi:hypothetical protein
LGRLEKKFRRQELEYRSTPEEVEDPLGGEGEKEFRRGGVR